MRWRWDSVGSASASMKATISPRLPTNSVGPLLLDLRYDHVVVPRPHVFLGAVGAGVSGELTRNAEVGAMVVLDAVGVQGGFKDAVVVFRLVRGQARVADVDEVGDARGAKDAHKLRNLLAGEPDGVRSRPGSGRAPSSRSSC